MSSGDLPEEKPSEVQRKASLISASAWEKCEDIQRVDTDTS